MDRINIKCVIGKIEVEIQLDKKVMPGETGPCYMITQGGCFKGYISCKKNGGYQPIGAFYYEDHDLKRIEEHLKNL